MATDNLLQAFVDQLVVILTRLSVEKVINAVQNEMLSKRKDLPDVVFTSRVKLSQECDQTCGTMNEAKLLSLAGSDNHCDDLDLINYSKLEIIHGNGSTYKLLEAVARLPEDSKDWPLSVDRCEVQHHKVLVFLNRRKCFSSLLPHVLARGHDYGRSCTRRQQVGVTCDSVPDSRDDLSLRQLRLQYLDSLLRNVFTASGHYVFGDRGDCTVHLHLATMSPKQQTSGRGRVLLVGDVKARLRDRMVEMSAGDFLRRRHQDVRQLSEVKSADLEVPPAREETLSRLADAVVRIELLQCRPTSQMCVHLCSPQDNQQLRGALFMLYNYTRMFTILRTFADKVREGVYPPLVPVHMADFSLLSQQEEWFLCRYLLMFPHVVESCVDHASSRPFSPHRLCSFLAELSRVYSGYYRRVRILTEPRDHLLPVMFARLHLLGAVEQVFRNTFSLFDVSPLEQM